MRLLLLAFLFLNFFFFGNGTPMKCATITTTDIFDDYSYGNITGSAMISVYKRSNIQYISVSNVDVVNYVINETATNFCIDPSNSCTSNLSIPLETQMGNGSFVMDAYFPKGNGIQFFHGIVDDGGFFGVDGSMYSIDKICTTQQSNQSNLEDKEVHCCAAFKPVPQAPINSPRCKKFQSRSSILNADDNYSIFFTSTMNFTLNGNDFIAVGSISKANGYNYSIEYWYNNYWMCDSPIGPANVNCDNYTFPDGDGKILINVEFVKVNIDDSGSGYGGMLARVLIRDGITLMEEGVPFTTTNNCQFQNWPYGGNLNQVVQNKFCCIEFENNFQPKEQQKMQQPHKIRSRFGKNSGSVKHRLSSC